MQNQSPEFDPQVQKIIRIKARSKVGAAGIQEQDVDDLVQECSLHLYMSLSKFNPDLASFHTFVDRIVENRLTSIIRYRTCDCRRLDLEPLSLNEVSKDSKGRSEEMLERISTASFTANAGPQSADDFSCVDLSASVGKVIGELSPVQKLICELLMNYSINEAVKRSGLCRYSFFQHKNRIKEIFRAKGF